MKPAVDACLRKRYAQPSEPMVGAPWDAQFQKGQAKPARPHRIWTSNAYAELLQKALSHLGVERFTIVSHSLASLIALDLALEHPSKVEGLVIIGGYFYPTARVDSFLASLAALPGVGDVIRYTVSPPITRVFLPAILRLLFSPASVTERFERGFPKSFAARPVQIGAEASHGALMVSSAIALHGRYGELKLPIVILAGEGDKIVDFERQSGRFHKEILQSELVVIPEGGHMAHHIEPNSVVTAVDGVTASRKHAAPRERADAFARL